MTSMMMQEINRPWAPLQRLEMPQLAYFGPRLAPCKLGKIPGKYAEDCRTSTPPDAIAMLCFKGTASDE